jgi:hypothetical protein
MRLAPAVSVLLALVASACAPTTGPIAQSMAACLAAPSDPNVVSIPALVDRADIIVLASVVRIDTLSVPSGVARDMPLSLGEGRRLALRATDTAKGTVAAEFAVFDGPCPLIAAKSGESFVLFLEDVANPDGSLRPIGLPVSVLRARRRGIRPRRARAQDHGRAPQ